MITWYKCSNMQFTASGYRNGDVIVVKVELYKFLGQILNLVLGSC